MTLLNCVEKRPHTLQFKLRENDMYIYMYILKNEGDAYIILGKKISFEMS